MASYLIKKDEKTNQIIYMEYELTGYKFTPKIKNKSYIKINHVTIIKPSLIEKTLLLKLKKTFTKLLYKVKLVLDDDDASDDEVALCLGEVQRLTGIILHKYDKFLKKSIAKEYLNRLLFLEKQLRVKLDLMNMKFLEYDYEEPEKQRGR